MNIKKSGAVIINNKKDSVLLLYRGDLKDWTFPKGHVEYGENYIETAIREVKEETGLDVKIIKQLCDVEYENIEGSVITNMFLAMSQEDNKLKIEHDGDILEWVNINEVNNKLSYDNLKDFFNKIRNDISSR